MGRYNKIGFAFTFTGTGSLTVLKRTTSDGSCAPVVANDRPATASIDEQAKPEFQVPSCDEETPGDDGDDGENPTSPPPVDSTAALKFCSKR